MTIINARLVTSGILIILSIMSGIWLSHTGRPLNTMIFTLHKLSALAAVVFLVMALYSPLKTVSPDPVIILLAALAALFLLTLFVTGGVLSSEKPLPDFILLLHKIFPAITILFLSGIVYFLVQKS